jgi:hypothetical protein
MASIIEYLPGIPKAYWVDYVKAIEPTKPLIVKAGEKRVQLFPSDLSDKRGIILQFALNSNNPNLQFNVVVDNKKISSNMTELYDAGYTIYVPNLPWLSAYNTTNNIYVVNLLAEIPFNNDVYAYVDNPTTSPITVGSMGFHAIVFNEGFYKALADLKNGKE